MKIINATLLSREYRNLSREEKEDLKKKGSDGSLRHKYGNKSFGAATRDAARLMVKRQQVQTAFHLRARAHTSRSFEKALETPMEDIDSEVRNLRADAWLLRRVEKDKAKVREEDLTAWRSDRGVAQRDAVLTEVPDLAEHASRLCGAPCGTF